VRVIVTADPANCSFQFNPVGTAQFTTSCDIAKGNLARASIAYQFEPGAPGSTATVRIGDRTIESYDARAAGAEAAARGRAFSTAVTEALTAAGYPAANNPTVVRMAHPWDLFSGQVFYLVILLTILVVYVTMVYGPIAAALVELFPTRIRYSAMSLPYHIGNGWFGGLLPATAFAMIAQTGDIYYGLWYPIVVAAMTFVIGMLFIPETKDRDILAHD